jgi:hypothetical protein
MMGLHSKQFRLPPLRLCVNGLGSLDQTQLLAIGSPRASTGFRFEAFLKPARKHVRLRTFEIVRLRPKSKELVAHAVQVEPVSTPEFPANREINRELRRIRLLGAI